MKNRTFVRFFALFLAVVMAVGMFALCASAEKKTIYDEENCALEYDNGVVTLKLNAEKLAALLKSRQISKESLKEVLPAAVYRVIDERSKASVIALLLDLAEADVFDYDEMLNAFAGNEAVMKKYINLDLFGTFYAKDVLVAELKKLYADGAMDEFFNAEGVRDALYAKLAVSDDLEALDDFDAFVDAVKAIESEKEIDENKELQALLPMREMTDDMPIKDMIRNASGSRVNKKLRAFFTQVLFGEVSTMYVDDTLVYSNYEFDHNAIQTAVLKGMPSVAELTTVADGDTVVDYVITTQGPNVNMAFGFKVVFVGDTSGINANAVRANSFFSYAVEDDGLIKMNFSFDERFVENYSKALDAEGISEARKLEYLGLYTVDGATLLEQFKGEKFEEFLSDAKTAGVKFSNKSDPNMELILKLRDLGVKYAAYETAFTTLDDAYVGDGVFVLRLTDVIPFDTISEKLHSRFSSIEEVLDWLKQDDHVIDTELTFEIPDFYRVRYFDADNNQLYVTYLPVGTSLDILANAPELAGHGEDGWFDRDGNLVTEMPEKDVDLYEEPDTVAIDIVKIWDDDNNRDGIRPNVIGVDIFANGQLYTNVVVVAETAYETEDSQTVVVDEGEDEVVGRKYDAVAADPLAGDDDIDDEDDEDEDDNVIIASVNENEWNFTVIGLPKYQNGEEVTYTIGEQETDGYTTEIVRNVITNTHVPETVTISGTKVWNDPTTKDQKRPESITIILFANGVEVDRVDVNGSGDIWDFEFADQYKYENGVEIVYTIDEVDVAGYNKEINGYEIVNSGVLGVSLFVLISVAAAGGVFAAVKVAKKRKDQE